ncbi:MAG: transglutaminase-like cysteine peptidase [Alphaproteobacteria bacterium]|nr:transglutaminase-like cysteine peptidase [Alphaproteobacteria bacterium]
MNKVLLIIAAALGSLLVTATTVQPATAGAPMGYLLMCLEHPNECKAGGASTVTASDKVLSTIKKVNASVNSRIRPKADGKVDIWSVNASAGDCEDFVLAKRKALIRAGIPAASLRIAAVKTRKGEGHAILIVNTSRGKIVLDNLTPTIKPLAQTGYRIVSVQSANPYKWS